MKKLSIIALVACVLTIISSCGQRIPKPDLKTDIDTMSYAMGLGQSQGLREYLMARMGVDTTRIDQVIKGIKEGISIGEDKNKAAYLAGVQIGQQIVNQMIPGISMEVFGSDSTKQLSTKNFVSGFLTGTSGKRGLYTTEQAQVVANQKMRAIKTVYMEKIYGENKKAGEKFLAENKTKDGINTLPSGVQYRVIKEGTGKLPKDTSMVQVFYEGKTINDSIFESTYNRKEPVTLRANQVIKGWTEALVHMPEGSEWEVYVPQELAYAEREAGQIKPFSALIFKIKLVGVDKGNLPAGPQMRP